MAARFLLISGAVHAALAIGAGAFGAHALRARLEPRALEIWDLAARYHQWGAVALFALGLAAATRPVALGAHIFHVGLLIFSGTLYVLALSGARWLGAITPIGGTAMIIGWLVIA